MSKPWIYAFCLFAITTSIYSDTDSEAPPSCPLKCDVLGEVNVIRQLVNQESIIRMGIDAQTQELRKTVIDIMTKLQQINSSLAMESSSTSQQTSLEDRISKVTKTLEQLNLSVLDADTRFGQVNSSLEQALARVERDVQTLQQTSDQMQDVEFTAYPSRTINTTANAKLQFDRIDRNDGQGYSLSTGVFTAPVAGMYHFYWSLLFILGGNVDIKFMLNGTRKVRSCRATVDGEISSTSGSIYLRLKVGDQVYLEADRDGGRVDSNRYSTFGGELIRH